MSENVEWNFPDLCPHCGSGRYHRDELQSIYDCGTVIVEGNDYVSHDCHLQTVAKLKAKIDALTKAVEVSEQLRREDS
jgi:uncharacterized protein (DUF983 family)